MFGFFVHSRTFTSLAVLLLDANICMNMEMDQAQLAILQQIQ
jgi:hypothetical protein